MLQTGIPRKASFSSTALNPFGDGSLTWAYSLQLAAWEFKTAGFEIPEGGSYSTRHHEGHWQLCLLTSSHDCFAEKVLRKTRIP